MTPVKTANDILKSVPDGTFWRWNALIALIIAVASVVAAHFHGLISAKDYTDTQVSRVKSSVENKIDIVNDKLNQQAIQLTEIQTTISVFRENRRRRDAGSNGN